MQYSENTTNLLVLLQNPQSHLAASSRDRRTWVTQMFFFLPLQQFEMNVEMLAVITEFSQLALVSHHVPKVNP